MSVRNVGLSDLIGDWIKDHPSFKDHYYIARNASGGITLYWIQCACIPLGHLPPTPKYDMLILDDYVEVWWMSERKVGAILKASSPTFFTDLERWMNESHD